MISKKMADALNGQVNAELYSAYLYLGMESYFESINLPGAARWMRAQTQEEVMHGLKIYDFIVERGGRAVLQAIEKPPGEWKSCKDAFESAYKHEQKVTGLINELVNLAIEEKDHATNNFLQWFVNEQVEEEASVSEVLRQLELTEQEPGAVFMVDRELGQRVFRPGNEGEE